MTAGGWKRAAALVLALLLAAAPAGLAEDTAAERVEDAPGELGEFDLAIPEGALPDATPVPTLGPEKAPSGIPYYTSVNYPEDKVGFEDEIWTVLTQRWGLDAEHAAALMGNMYAESGFSPYNVQGREGWDDRGRYRFRSGDRVGFGLCQWTSAGRKRALYRLAVAHGDPGLVWDFDIQMTFLREELDLAALSATEGLYAATEWVALWFERPSQAYENSWPGTRYEYARRIYRDHTGADYDEPPLRFTLSPADGPIALEDAGVEGLVGALAVEGNYYWRLTIEDETEPGWLSARSASLYSPDRLEDCACGYACEGVKAVELAASVLPPPGQTWSATLRFEIFRGDGETRTLTVTARQALPGWIARAIEKARSSIG